MYMDKQVKRGYNEYIRLDEGIGKDAMMDVALLVMEDGDTWSCEEPEKEVAALVFDGKCTIKWENESYDVDRPNPFDYNPSCLHVCKGVNLLVVVHSLSVHAVSVSVVSLRLRELTPVQKEERLICSVPQQ